ncbi:Sjoegren syndrome/scleroderma autoantigen 1 [Trinorchestia longiramus]|nr:Sjoegren syndrome/scleroderma autoantigen 1 [Trinorchestia longiramus]
MESADNGLYEKTDFSSCSTRKSKYRQKYSKNWTKDDTIAKWLKPSSKGEGFGYCGVCNVHLSIQGGKSDLQKHAAGKKHMIKFEFFYPEHAKLIGSDISGSGTVQTSLSLTNSEEMDEVAGNSAETVEPTPETRTGSRSDAVAKEMGQLLLQGYKLLLTVCETCDCILMEDQQGLAFCVGCTLDGEYDEANSTETPRQGYLAPLKEIKVGKSPGSAAVNSNTTQTSGRILVHGVDLTDELQGALSALKNKLSLLTGECGPNVVTFLVVITTSSCLECVRDQADIVAADQQMLQFSGATTFSCVVPPKIANISAHNKSKKHQRNFTGTSETDHQVAEFIDASEKQAKLEVSTPKYVRKIETATHFDNVDDDLEASGEDAPQSTVLGKKMGQLLLQGYKLLLSVCQTCNFTLMEDHQGMELCVRCSSDQETENAGDSVKPFKIPKYDKSSNKGKRKYKKKWEAKYVWLRSSFGGQRAYCTFCKTYVLPKLYNISAHDKTRKHQVNSSRMSQADRDQVVESSFDEREIQEEIQANNGDSALIVHGVDMTEEVQGVLTALKTKLGLLSENLLCVHDSEAVNECLRSMSIIASVIEKYKKL